MPTIRHLSRLSATCGALVAAVSATSCTPSTARLPPPPTDTAVGSPAAAPRPEYVPVVRYGRYTLVELAPTSAQRDLLQQVIDVTIPNTRAATVGDALRHVLDRSGYQLCASPDIAPLSTLPLPAAHYRLGPVPLRDALLTLAGPAWELQVDDSARRVCFARATAPSPAPSAAQAAPAGIDTIERYPLPEPSQP